MAKRKRRADVVEKEKKVLDFINNKIESHQKISFSLIATELGISKTFLYNNDNIRKLIEDNRTISEKVKKDNFNRLKNNNIEKVTSNNDDASLLNAILKKRVNLEELFLLIRIRKGEAREVYNASRKVGYKLTDDEFNQIKERKFLINGKF